MRNIFRGRKHVERLLVFSEFFKKPNVLSAIQDRRKFFAERYLDLVCRLVERCGTEEAETARALLDGYERMYDSYKLFLNDNFSHKTIKDLHEEYYEEMKKIIEELRRIYLLKHSRYVTKILESLLLEVIDATNNYQRAFVDVIDNKGLIANVDVDTEEDNINSFDYFDDTVLRFRMPTITTLKQSNILPKMSAINHSHHGKRIADYMQFEFMKECPFYTVHHPFFGNNTYSIYTHYKNTNFTLPPQTYTFKADEEETLEQTKERPQPTQFFYIGPEGYITHEPILPYEVMQKIFGKYSNWDYYRKYKESQKTKKNGIKEIRTTNLPMYKIIYDIKDLPDEKVADFIDDNNLALNKTLPYFMPEDLSSFLHVEQDHSFSDDSSTTHQLMCTQPQLTDFDERQLDVLLNQTRFSSNLLQYLYSSQESQVLKRPLQTTIAAKEFRAPTKPPKNLRDSKELQTLKRSLENITTTKMLKVSGGLPETINDKENRLSKMQKLTSIPFNIPILSIKPVQISGENRTEQRTYFESTTTSKTLQATFYKKRVKISPGETPYDIPTSKKPFNIFDIYRSFEVEYSQETTTTDFEIDIPIFNLTHYKSLQTSGERHQYHRQYVIEYLKLNDKLLKLNYKFTKNKTSRIDYYNYINRLKRLDYKEIGKFNVNGTAENLFNEMWQFQQHKYSTSTNVAIT